MSERSTCRDSCETSEKLADMDQVLRDRQKESWKAELQDIGRKRTELLLEHQKVQKRSQKLRSLQDK